MTPIDRTAFLDAMRWVATSVVVVTAADQKGRKGVTISAMCSVSAEPPSLLVCIHHLSPVSLALETSRCFCVNLLQHEQSFVSETFAGRTQSLREDKFACADWYEMNSGAPALVGAAVSFDCRLASDVRFGSHRIFIGEVRSIRTADTAVPLLHWNRAYHSPAAAAATSAP